jgi:hypothetical protein
MTTLPLPSQTLARLQSRAEGGHDDARVLLHLIDRADKRDQDVAAFVDSYSSTIAALCRRLEALERGANDLPAPEAPADDSPVANALTVAEAALADVAEGEAVSPRADECLHWTETRCTEALAAIRPVMEGHGIRTSEFPPAVPAPAPATPTPRTALTSDDIPPGPLSEDDLRRGWNQQADEHNQWESLETFEQLAWAQARAIGSDRNTLKKHCTELLQLWDGDCEIDSAMEHLRGLLSDSNQVTEIQP